MTGRLQVDQALCAGCTSCMLACSLENEGTHSFSLSRVHIERNEERADFRPRVCIQCVERLCVRSCPVGALSVHPETGATLVDSEQCIGCRKCEAACPHGGVRFHEGRKLPLICDLCGGDPACTRTCKFPGAIRFVVGEESP